MANPVDNIKLVAKTTDGIIAFKFILNTMCQVSEANYNTDTVSMARQEGRRSVGLDLKGALGDDLYYSILNAKV